MVRLQEREQILKVREVEIQAKAFKSILDFIELVSVRAELSAIEEFKEEQGRRPAVNIFGCGD